jgi:hypothetical protein
VAQDVGPEFKPQYHKKKKKKEKEKTWWWRGQEVGREQEVSLRYFKNILVYF